MDRTTTSLDGLEFTALENSADGEVGDGTVFRYGEQGGVIHASYAGGAVTQGFLVGARVGERLDFRYCHLSVEGVTGAGHCVTIVTTQSDGRVRLDETWDWESRPGSGTSVLVEICRN